MDDTVGKISTVDTRTSSAIDKAQAKVAVGRLRAGRVKCRNFRVPG